MRRLEDLEPDADSRPRLIDADSNVAVYSIISRSEHTFVPSLNIGDPYYPDLPQERPSTRESVGSEEHQPE